MQEYDSRDDTLIHIRRVGTFYREHGKILGGNEVVTEKRDYLGELMLFATLKDMELVTEDEWYMNIHEKIRLLRLHAGIAEDFNTEDVDDFPYIRVMDE